MKFDTLRRITIFVLLCIAQALVLNRIRLFGFATPQLYVYFVIMFPKSQPKWAVILWSFTLGLVIDTFFNTPGVTSASLTMIGAIQPYLLSLFVPREADPTLLPSAKHMGWEKFAAYTSTAVLLFCLVFFTIEAFSLMNWIHWMQCVIGSAGLTILLIFTLESIRGNDKQTF